MKIKLSNGEELELVNSFRVFMYYEQIAGHSIDFTNFTSNDVLILFYSVVIASLQRQNKEMITLLEFMNLVDDNGGDKCLLEFSKFFIDLMKKQYEIIDSMDALKEEDKEEGIEDGAKKKI